LHSIKIVSPVQTSNQFIDKNVYYFKAGISKLWIVYPEAISIKIFFADISNKIYTNTMPNINFAWIRTNSKNYY
jgi:hypothetical protein